MTNPIIPRVTWDAEERMLGGYKGLDGADAVKLEGSAEETA